MKMFLVELPTKYDEIGICPEVERILDNKGFGMRMIVVCNELPLFLTTNLDIINHKILKNEGSLEIISRDFSRLDELPTKLRGDTRFYKSLEEIKNEFSVIYGQSSILIRKGKFVLFEDHPDISKKLYDKFDRMAKLDNLIKEDYT